jgi:ribosomal protein L11 methyltransferase
MQWLESKVVFESKSRAIAFELIGDAFFDIGLKGIVQNDPDLEPNEGWGDDALKPAETPSVVGYFADNDQLSSNCRKLEQALRWIQQSIDLQYQIIYLRLDEDAWAHSWKAFFHPVKVSQRIVVKPTWEDYSANPGEVVVEIDPGMAFGTGTHPTTMLCLQLIEKYLTPGQSLLDVGTGSGILMVAAAKLGAVHAAGIDIDDVSVSIARNNLESNRIDSARYEVSVGDLSTVSDCQFDLVVANILSKVILDLLDEIRLVLKPSGMFICSGIIQPKKDLVLQKMKSVNMNILEVAIYEDWVAIVGQDQSPR